MNSGEFDDDDHYIANAQNAHVRTTQFEDGLNKVARDSSISDDDLNEKIYDTVLSKIATAPEQPDDHALLCRYLSPARFLEFLVSFQIAFPTANQFSDQWECRIPEDYDHAVLSVLSRSGRSGDLWEAHVRNQASQWNISCWTELEHYFDDHLMWKTYAGGIDGVGITIRYGALRDHLRRAAEQGELKGTLHYGRVSYQPMSLLPFNKHAIFRNEREVRFAFKSNRPRLAFVSVKEIKDAFGIRISPAASVKHRDTIRDLWTNCGGRDRVNHPT